MNKNDPDRILVADNNPLFRETLALWLMGAGYEVMTADTGEHAFTKLRDRQHPVGWLYTRASLPLLIDGWILASEFHDAYPKRPVVIAAPDARRSACGDIILQQPSPAIVLATIRELTIAIRTSAASAIEPCSQQHAA
jgi:CheY-like chemotaxis protein